MQNERNQKRHNRQTKEREREGKNAGERLFHVNKQYEYWRVVYEIAE